MVDIKLSNGNLELFLSNFETYDSLESKFMEVFNCTQDQVIDIIINDFTIKLVGNSNIDMSFDNSEIDKIFKGYKELIKFSEEKHDIILTYLTLKGNNLSIGKNAMYNALYCYFGTYKSDKEAVLWFLYYKLYMDRRQIHYMINTLECTDKIMEVSLIKYGNKYYLNEHNY